MSVRVRASRARYHAPRNHKYGPRGSCKGVCIEINLPDELLEDDHASERITALVMKRVRENLVEGVFKGTVIHFEVD